MCRGSGICTRMPETAGSAFRRTTCASTSSWEAVAGSSIVSEVMPASTQARPLLRT